MSIYFYRDVSKRDGERTRLACGGERLVHRFGRAFAPVPRAVARMVPTAGRSRTHARARALPISKSFRFPLSTFRFWI